MWPQRAACARHFLPSTAMRLPILTGNGGNHPTPAELYGRLFPIFGYTGAPRTSHAARDRGLSICLGSDWGPSGTKHVLAELKVAKLVSQKQGFGLKDRDLVAMVTSNAGDVLSRCWSRQIGRLVQGAFADVTVLRPRGNGDTWSQIVAATEREIMLVVTGQPSPLWRCGCDDRSRSKH